MRQLLFIFISILSPLAASAADCPDLTGQYVCGVESVNDVIRDEFPLDVSFAIDGAPTYYFSSPTMAIPQTLYVANEQVHEGISPGLEYKASCSEKKLIVKFYIEKRAIDVRIYSKNKNGFQVDTLNGDREFCRFNRLF